MINFDLKLLIENIVLQELSDLSEIPQKFTGLIAFINAYNDVKSLLPDAPTINLEWIPSYVGTELEYQPGRVIIGPRVSPTNMFQGNGHDIFHILTVNIAKQFTSAKNKHKQWGLPQNIAEELFGNAIWTDIQTYIINSIPMDRQFIYGIYNGAMERLRNAMTGAYPVKKQGLNDKEYRAKISTHVRKLQSKLTGIPFDYKDQEDQYLTPEDYIKIEESPLFKIVGAYNKHLSRLKKAKFTK